MGFGMVTGYMCSFSTKRKVGSSLIPARKRTRLMSNARELLRGLWGPCKVGHVHAPLLHGRARDAAIYNADLCRAMCRGFIMQNEKNMMSVKRSMIVKAEDGIGEAPDHGEDQQGMTAAWGDVSNKTWDAGRVRVAREEEMDYMNAKRAREKLTKSKATASEAQGGGTRWIDTGGRRCEPQLQEQLSWEGTQHRPGGWGCLRRPHPQDALSWLASEAAMVDLGGGRATRRC